MKRFNINELIWFILLLFLTTLWGYLISSGNIYDLVSPRMIKYSYFAIVIFIILTIFQLSKIVTFPTRVDMSYKFIPLIFTLFMAVAYVSLNSTFTNSSSILLTAEQVKFNYTGDYISIGNTNNSNYSIIKELNIYLNKEPNKDSEHIGKVISIVGYIDKSKCSSSNHNTFLISRDEISCCLQDLSTISVLCKETQSTKNNSNNKTNTNTKSTNNSTINSAHFENGSWVKALGTIKYENGTIYLDLLEITQVKEPEKKYYTPEL